jgi:DNA-binding Lrp family transcriptional regulator
MHQTFRVYVQELSQKLDLSAGMCSKVLKEFEEDGILRKRDLGKDHCSSS